MFVFCFCFLFFLEEVRSIRVRKSGKMSVKVNGMARPEEGGAKKQTAGFQAVNTLVNNRI